MSDDKFVKKRWNGVRMESPGTPGAAARPRRFFVASAAHLEDQSDEVVLQLHDVGPTLMLEDVHDRLDGLLEPGPRELVVDLSEIAHLTSTTIAALLWIRQRCSARGVEVALRAASRRNLETLRRIDLLGGAPARRPPYLTDPGLGRPE